jgi:hypothetical protein
MTPDETLKVLLKQGRGIEPRPGFEAAVWTRIHAAEPILVSRWQGWATPLAMAAGIMFGIGLGLIVSSAGKGIKANTALVQNGSLTGAYLLLASGGDQ